MYSTPSIARVKSLKKEPFLPMRCFTKTEGIVMSTYVHSQNMEGGLYTFGREKQFHDAVIAMSIIYPSYNPVSLSIFILQVC